jgi:GNAT superfamily N-acetyltransferase
MGTVDGEQAREGAELTTIGEADRVVYRLGPGVDPSAVAAVYRSVGWDHLARDPGQLGVALRASTEVATAWEGEEAVGVARLLSDRVFHGLLLGVAVRPDRQGRGIGSRLVQALVDTSPGMHYHLWTRSRRFAFYGRLGFQRDETAMDRPAGRSAPSPWKG